MTLLALVSLLLFFFVGGILALWFWYEHRSNRPYQTIRNQSPFVCIRCHTLYQESRGKEMATCPSCGFENLRLHF